jgi:hypothetical protein
MDIQGVLGIDSDVRNGFDGIRVHYKIDADATPEEIQALVAQSQKRAPSSIPSPILSRSRGIRLRRSKRAKE